MVWVDQAGDNSIVVIAGANAGVADRSAEVVAAVDGLGLAASDVVLAQGETSLAVTATVFAAARAHGARTVLNLAPYQPPAVDLLAATSMLVVNESEFAALVHRSGPVGSDERVAAARSVVGQGPGVVVITLGSRGAVAVGADVDLALQGRAVDVVDTTGAGDGFVGVLAGALARSVELEPALAYATAAASLVVQRRGAASSMPSRAEIDGVADRPISAG
jgi:ribokinase